MDNVKKPPASIIELAIADFERKLRGCESTYSFPSVALGCPDNVVHCQMRGEHQRHKAIYHGFPYEWDDEGRGFVTMRDQ
jgi:hypothetical protein